MSFEFCWVFPPKVKKARFEKMTEEIFSEMIGFNKQLNKNDVMLRCGDCNFLTHDIPFVEQIIK